MQEVLARVDRAVIGLVILLLTGVAHAADLRYPGEFWFKYDQDTHNNGSDLDGGRLHLDALQGVELNRNEVYVGLSVYRPSEAASDSYSKIGVKHRTKLGIDFGVEQNFTFGNPDRTVFFTEYYKTWDLGR